jgi:hypothetical protein
MLEYLPYLSIALVLIGTIGLGWRHRRPRTELPQQDDPVTVISDWKPTGKIDFGCCSELPNEQDVEALFFLRVEEYRLVQSLMGTRRMEIRWRTATLAETKDVVSRYNARSGLAYGERLSLVHSASIVPDLASVEPGSPPALIQDGTRGTSRATLHHPD